MWLGIHASFAHGEDLGIRVPEGFEVTRFADDALAHDIYSMTIDAQGRVVVAGAGYVKILHDDDQDGRADRATLFSELPKSGAHGMYFDGPDLICTGDNGVHRLRDRDKDGRADGDLETWTSLKHPEHGANGIIRGPDGCYYLVCGNDAGISAEHAVLATSPVKQPHSGGIVRFSPEGKPLDVYADGFRNPYDLDIDAAGHLLSVDSDGERDHHLPWYAPMRMFDIAQGREHGWLLKGWTQSWNRPESFFDSMERAAEFGRGSPTGVAVYRHKQFPKHYRDGVFAACWTFGRIYYVPLTREGASASGQPETFLETTGDIGFAPCDLAVGPEGDLFVAIGGRRTLGSVFRIRYLQPEQLWNLPEGASTLSGVLEANQPLSSWSRAGWVPLAKYLGATPFADYAADDSARSVALRVRAIEVLVEVFGGVKPETARKIIDSADPAVRARLAWALGRGAADADVVPMLAKLTSDPDSQVRRYAWESLATCEAIDPAAELQPDWGGGLSDTSRRVRTAAIDVARGVGRESYQAFAAKVRIAAGAVRLRLAQMRIELPQRGADARERLPLDQMESCAAIVGSASQELAVRLEAVRLLQLALGDVLLLENAAEVYAGYQAKSLYAVPDRVRDKLVLKLVPCFPSRDEELDRELARLLGMLTAYPDTLRAAIATKWTEDSPVEDDLHYLIVASLLAGERQPDFTQATANALLRLHGKLSQAGEFTSRNWPFRVKEVFTELVRRDPALPQAIFESAKLGHPGHSLFEEELPTTLRSSAVRKLWSAVLATGQEPSPQMVAMAGELPAREAAGLLRPQWENGTLRDAVILQLARAPQPEDRAKFIEALSSPQPAVVERAAYALPALGVRHTTAEMAAALRALKQACSLVKQAEPRTALMRLLEFWTEDGADVEWDPDPTKQWIGWYNLFAGYYPAEYAQLVASTTTDLATWRSRLNTINWDAGDPVAGRQVFELRSCHRCHQQSGHLGPELKGAVTRMSRDDLFTAILDPNLEVSPTHMTTLIATESGQVYHGLVVYESPESTLLQTGPDTTVRITSTEATAMRPSSQSLMPTGLLDPLTDKQVADLYAFLKTLGDSNKK